MLSPQFVLPLAHELVIDLFAGGGGASTGIEQALGRFVDIAVNHDPEAVSLHQANHPQTLHYVSDVFEGGAADELSKPTGVPAPFKVLCYIEVPDFQNVERRIHGWLKAYRISESREFFRDGLEYAVRLLWWHRDRLSFTQAGQAPDSHWSPLADALADEAWSCLQESPDPWAPVAPEPAAAPAPDLRVIDGGANAA